jgi:hypothetical protein
MKMITRGLIAMALSLIGLFSIAVPSEAVVAHFRNQGATYSIYMCKNWGNPGDGRNEKGSCEPDSPRRALYPGQRTNTTFGWDDTDGFWLPSGYRIGLALYPSTTYFVRYKSWGWRKVYGCAGCTYNLKKYIP